MKIKQAKRPTAKRLVASKSTASEKKSTRKRDSSRTGLIEGVTFFAQPVRYKVVDGQAVNMGTLEFRYIENEHALVCDAPQGTRRFTIDGDKITGTLTRPDHTLFRRVAVRKDP